MHGAHICLLLADVGLAILPDAVRAQAQSGNSSTSFPQLQLLSSTPFFSRESLCDMFLKCLERTPRRYRCHIYGYVVMPEHVYLLLSEPEVKVLATAIQALKVSFVRCSGRLHQGTSRQKRYFDCNVGDGDSFSEKLRYMHRNL
jgi:putative transposase